MNVCKPSHTTPCRYLPMHHDQINPHTYHQSATIPSNYPESLNLSWARRGHMVLDCNMFPCFITAASRTQVRKVNPSSMHCGKVRPFSCPFDSVWNLLPAIAEFGFYCAFATARDLLPLLVTRTA